MSHQKTIFLALTMLLLLFPNVIHAEDSGTITGVVLDGIAKKPLSGIQIQIVHSSGKTYRTITDKEGNFSIGILLEEWQVEAKGKGYNPAAKRVRVIPGETVRADFELSPSLTFYGEEFVVAAPKPSPKEEVIISKETIDAGQIKNSSVNLFNDLSETLKTMPGVITPGNFSGAMFIRGGDPLETIYMLDQVFIDWPYRWGGMMTMFNTRLIEDVDFYAGGFPAEGGNSLAGVIDVKYKKGDLKKSSGLLDVSPTTTELFLNGPIKKEKSSYLLSAKRTYYDFLAKYFTDSKESTVFPYFNDGFSKLYFDLSPEHKLTIFSVYAGEGMDMKIEEKDDPELEGGRFKYSYQTGIMGVDHKWILKEDISLQTTLSSSLDKGSFDLHHPEYIWKEDMNPMDINLKSDLDWQVTPSHKLRSGIYISDNKVKFSGSFDYEVIEGTETLIKKREIKPYDFKKDARYIGFYTWDRWKLSPRLTADIGLRHESLDLVNDTALTPRLSLKFDISDKTSLKLAYAHNSQFPTNIYWIDEQMGNPNLKRQKGIDYIVGMGKKLTDDMRLKVETYYKDLKDLIVEDNKLNFSNKGKGKAYGLEFFLQRKEGKKLDGWISYAWSKSERTRGDDKYLLENRGEGVADDAEFYPTSQDRRHTLSIVGNYKLTPKWRLSGKWQLNTGNPYTPLDSVVEYGTTTAMIYKPVWGKYNSMRMPRYEALDIKVERLFKRSSTYFQFLNLYNHKNVYDYYYTDDFKQRKESLMFGFMCLGGFELRF